MNADFSLGTVAAITEGALPAWQFQAPSTKGPAHTYTGEDGKVAALGQALDDLYAWRSSQGGPAAQTPGGVSSEAWTPPPAPAP